MSDENKITDVVVLGESALDGKVLKMKREALEGLLPDDTFSKVASSGIHLLRLRRVRQGSGRVPSRALSTVSRRLFEGDGGTWSVQMSDCIFKAVNTARSQEYLTCLTKQLQWRMAHGIEIEVVALGEQWVNSATVPFR